MVWLVAKWGGLLGLRFAKKSPTTITNPQKASNRQGLSKTSVAVGGATRDSDPEPSLQSSFGKHAEARQSQVCLGFTGPFRQIWKMNA